MSEPHRPFHKLSSFDNNGKWHVDSTDYHMETTVRHVYSAALTKH